MMKILDWTYNEDNFECPYCGHTEEDSWEYSEDIKEIECSSCEKVYEVEIENVRIYRGYKI